jgi:hypothetical protein
MRYESSKIPSLKCFIKGLGKVEVLKLEKRINKAIFYASLDDVGNPS